MTSPHYITRDRQVIRYNGETISFGVIPTKTKRLTISVFPDLAVRVKVPNGKSVVQIKARVERRAAWIARQLQHFRRCPPVPPRRRYVSGETHVFLGRQYRLKIHAANNNAVKLVGRYLHVYSPAPRSAHQVRALVEDWYREHAKELLHRRVQQCHQHVRRFGIPLPTVRIQKMQQRWGSCTQTASVILNTELIKAPSQCIDYVIVHELCHLRVHGHNDSFFRLLTTCMPDWKRRKERLDSLVMT